MDRPTTIALTPVAPGAILAPFTLGIPRMVSELAPMPSGVREIDININRHRLQRKFLSLRRDFDFVLLIDSDVVITPDVLPALLASWKPGTTPCINTKGATTGHIITSCALVSVEDYSAINYLDRPDVCQCLKLPNPFYLEGYSGREI